MSGLYNAQLVSPLVNNLVNEIHNESNTNNKYRISEKVFVVIGNHEIDPGYTHQYKQEGIRYPEIRTEFNDLPENDIFNYPDRNRNSKEQGKIFFLFLKKSPLIKLVGKKKPFCQNKQIGWNSIAGMMLFNKVIADDFNQAPQ